MAGDPSRSPPVPPDDASTKDLGPQEGAPSPSIPGPESTLSGARAGVPAVAGQDPFPFLPAADKPDLGESSLRSRILSGCMLNHYRLVRLIARGGMGSIWEALDTRLNRRVALKVIKAGEDASELELAYFRREGLNSAKLRHPNIIPVHEVGSAEGLDYMVMDLVEGEPLSEVLQKRQLSYRQKAQILERVARAVQYAHTCGVVHRDLKPANVMLDYGRAHSPSGVRGPTAAGVAGVTGTGGAWPGGQAAPPAGARTPLAPWLDPVVLDFGVAKDLQRDATLTQTGHAMGSPEYMSPEQAAGRHREIGPCSDVYSLGAILYVMLTGRPPFTGENSLEILRSVLDDEPLPPREAAPGVPRDLETVCLKCLAKNPRRRYHTAAALADDLKAWLDGESISARPATPFERVLKRVVRNPAPYAVGGVAALLLVAVTAYYVHSLNIRRLEAVAERDRAQAAERAAEQERQAADQQRQAADHQREVAQGALKAEAAQRAAAEEAKLTAEREAYASEIRLAAEQVEAGEIGDANLILDRLPRAYRHWEWGRLKYLCQREERVLRGHARGVIVLAVSPDGKTIAGGAEDGSFVLWDANSGRRLASPRGHTGPVISAAFSPNGQCLLTLGRDDWLAPNPNSTARIWDVGTGRERLALETYVGGRCPAAFSPDGQRVLSAFVDHRATIRDALTGRELFCLRGHKSAVDACAFSPDGRFAGTAATAEVKVWDAATGKAFLTLRGPDEVHDLVFSPDGRYLMVLGLPGWLKPPPSLVVWETATGKEVAVLRRDTDVSAGCFSPDSRSIVTGTSAGTLQRWELPGAKPLYSKKAHEGTIHQTRFSLDGKRLLTCGSGQAACVWEAATGELQYSMRGHTDGVLDVSFLPGGPRVVTASLDGTVRIWDPSKTKEEKRVFSCGHASDCTAFFSGDGKRIGIGDEPSEGTLRCRSLDVASGQVLATYVLALRGSLWLDMPCKRLLSRADGKLFLHDFTTGKTLWTIPEMEYTRPVGVCGICEFHQEGDVLLFLNGKEDKYAAIEAQTGKLLWSRKGKPRTSRLADGMTAFWAAVDGKLLRLDRSTGAEHVFWENPTLTRDGFVDVSEDEGCVLVSGTSLPAAWDVKKNQVLFTVGREGNRAFFCHKRVIGTEQTDGRGGALWDAATGMQIVEGVRAKSLFGDRPESLYQANRRRLRTQRWMFVGEWSASDNRIVDLETGKVVGTLERHRAESDPVFSKDGKRVLTTDDTEHTVRLRDVATGRELLCLKGHSGELSQPEFSPDGLSILTSAKDGTAILWPAVDWTKE